MFHVEINGAEVFEGTDFFAARGAFRDMCATMTEGDEVTMWVKEKLLDIKTKFFEIPCGADNGVDIVDAFAHTERWENGASFWSVICEPAPQTMRCAA